MKKTLKRINEASLRRLIERKVNEILNEPVNNDDANFRNGISRIVKDHLQPYQFELQGALNVLSKLKESLNWHSRRNGGKKIVCYKSNGQPYDVLVAIEQATAFINKAIVAIQEAY